MIVENLEKISFNQRRKILLDELPNIFEKLSPDKVCSNIISEVYEPKGKAGRLFVLGFGKASIPMYSGVRKVLRDSIHRSWIIVPDDDSEKCDFPELNILHGTHPITGKQSEASTREMLEGIGKLNENDTVIVLISGGGSALFEIPVQGVNIEEIAKASQCLMNSDADIYELNTFRKFFSAVKGGRLLQYLKPARIIGLVISDVFGDDLSMIASGPLTPVKLTGTKLKSLVSKYSEKCPLLQDMANRIDLEDLKTENPARVEQHIVLRNLDFVEEFEHFFAQKGFDSVSLGSNINGEVSSVSEKLATLLKDLRSIKSKGFWFVFGGETTVNVTGDGEGGRNQEIATRVMLQLRPYDFTFMSIGTDGIDGKSPAMGGLVDTQVSEEIGDEEAEKYLKASDTFNLLSRHNSAIISGRTGTNVSDLAVGYFDFKGDSLEDS